jgi:SWIM zinc finger
MAIIATTIPALQDVMDNNDEREFWTVVREHERPPYFFTDEGVGNRLNRAARVVTDGRITPNSDGSYTVEGSERRTYRVSDSCSCPQSQKGKSKWCYHAVAVALYVEWQRRLRPLHPTRSPLPDPVALGTLRAGTLPLPPVTVDERLSQATTLPQEDRMADDDDGYIPEPAQAATAVLEPPVPPAAVTTPATSSLDARALLESMAAWKEQRQLLARYIKEQLTDGVDYYTLRIKGRDTKPTLSKAGSEKFLAIFKLTATFQQDQATWTMLGSKEGVLCYTCTLLTREGQVVGEGRGARTLAQDQGDINKAVKMAQKSAQIDAILRTGCLSDVFTQDINEPDETPTAPVKPNPLHPAAALRQRIWQYATQHDKTIKTREDVESFVKARTGMDLHPDFYQAIVNRLEEVGR